MAKRAVSASHFAVLLLSLDAILVCLLIIAFVPYTKIDWDAYMSQVEGFVGGERDYTKLEGDTGPLVYPAGFLYVYSCIRFLTGGDVFPAQILFGILYITNLAIVFVVYIKTKVLPWWALCLLSLSKRIHSIFMLRLFNDCISMTLLHAALALILHQKWHLGLIIFSGAVSIKMNILLFAPPLFILMLKGMTLKGLISALSGAALVQILLGFPFLLSYPFGYLSRSFNVSSSISGTSEISAASTYRKSVNFKFVPGEMFVSKQFASALLVINLLLLLVFAHCRWCRHEGGLHRILLSKLSPQETNTNAKNLSRDHIATVMFVGNFVGVVCARSLHYQFYSCFDLQLQFTNHMDWTDPPVTGGDPSPSYSTADRPSSVAHVLRVTFGTSIACRFLLWKTPFPTALRLLLFCGVELCWNIYPWNFYSSIVLFFCHSWILWGLWIAKSELPYVDKPLLTKKD